MALRWESVGDQGDLVTAKMTVQFGEELHDRFVVVRAWLHAEDEGGFAAVGPEAHGGGHRPALPVEVVGADGGLALRCPGGSHRGEEADPGLVLEDDPGPPGPGDHRGSRPTQTRRRLKGHHDRGDSFVDPQTLNDVV